MTVTATCARCGTTIVPGTHFCARCGADVSGEQGNLATAMVRPTPPTAATPTQTGLPQAAQLDALRRATLGEYDILGELGRGGMATVYLAHDIALDRKVAIKVMSPTLFSGEGMVERFKREARTAAALSHPHIIPIFAVKESAQLVYFVMKFIEGRALDSLIKSVGVLPIPVVQAILYQVGSALGYAHRRGVVHRDMKPANIMLDADGWAIVTDFGIAKVSEARGLTVTGATIGTPSYMSPEQCAAKKELTGASDQYSLGIVAYEMLTGRLPFVADSMMGIMYAHFHEPPPPIAELRPDCPADVVTTLMRMLEKDPERRWPDVESAVAAIGGAPLAHDDPIRAELRTLAAEGANALLAKTVSTPVSPLPASRAVAPKARVPATKTAAPAVLRPRRFARALWGVPIAAVAVAAWWLVARPRREVSPPAATEASHPKKVAVAPRETVPSPTPTRPESAATVHAAPAPLAVEPQARRTAPPTRLEEPPAPGVTRRSEGLLRLAQARALARRLRAASAGASPTELAAGDAEAKQAEALAQQGRLPAALARLEAAIERWTEAERTAHARPRRERPPLAVAPEQPGDPRQEIEAAIAAYARAFESRDLSRVRRAYPGLTVQQSQEWGRFFMDARNLRVNLRVTAVEQTDYGAEASVEGSYEYESLGTGRGERQPVSLSMRLERSMAGWRLVSIRQHR